jgi:hypothetical protein
MEMGRRLPWHHSSFYCSVLPAWVCTLLSLFPGCVFFYTATHFKSVTINQTKIFMKPFGIILIAAGILMFVFGKISFTKKEKVVDIGPVEINKNEKKTVDWPNYAGGIAILAGVIVLFADRKKS